MNNKLKLSLAEKMLKSCGIDDIDGPDKVEDWVEKIFIMGQSHQYKRDIKAINEAMEPMRAPQPLWDRMRFIISGAAPKA